MRRVNITSNRADISDVGVPNTKASDNCYQITKPALLMYSSGGIPQNSPPNHMMSPDHVAVVYIASFELANQSSVSDQPISFWNLIRPHPHGVQKTMVNAGLPSF